MNNLRTFLIVSLLLSFIGFTGCSTTELAEKSNEERISNQRYKVSQLRSEDAYILNQIDQLLARTEELINRADKVREDDEDRAALILDAAEAVLVEANTRRLYAVRRASYQTAQEAYIQRAGKIRALRTILENQLPALTQ